MQIRAFVIKSSLGLSNLNIKGKTKWTAIIQSNGINYCIKTPKPFATNQDKKSFKKYVKIKDAKKIKVLKKSVELV